MAGGDEEIHAASRIRNDRAAARASAGSASAAWATRWPSASPRPAPTSPSGTARARRRAAGDHGAKIAERVAELAACDIVFCMVSTWDDVKEVIAGPTACCPARQGAEASSSNARRSRSKARRSCARCCAKRGVELLAAPVSGNAKVIKAGTAVVRLLGAEAGVRRGAAVPEDDRAGGELRRRGRARAHRQDLPQRVPRRGDAVARRDHRARAEGRRAAARVPRLHEPERDGLDVLALQDAGVRQPRLQGDVHAEAAAQGPRPRPRRRRSASRCRCRSRRSRATSSRR